MLEQNDEYSINIVSTLRWQGFVVLAVQVLVALVFGWNFGVLAGGSLVMISTWHVFKSVMVSQGDKARLMQAAGLRFILLLMGLALMMFIVKLQAMMVVLGMVVAYAALYVQSLMVIFKRMKGS